MSCPPFFFALIWEKIGTSSCFVVTWLLKWVKRRRGQKEKDIDSASNPGNFLSAPFTLKVKRVWQWTQEDVSLTNFTDWGRLEKNIRQEKARRRRTREESWEQEMISTFLWFPCDCSCLYPPPFFSTPSSPSSSCFPLSHWEKILLFCSTVFFGAEPGSSLLLWLWLWAFLLSLLGIEKKASTQILWFDPKYFFLNLWKKWREKSWEKHCSSYFSCQVSNFSSWSTQTTIKG